VLVNVLVAFLEWILMIPLKTLKKVYSKTKVVELKRASQVMDGIYKLFVFMRIFCN
jgi:hypothetical protein